MPIKPLIKKRKRIFVGTEGESEKALVKWLQMLCDNAGAWVHLTCVAAQGGDCLSVVEYCYKQYQEKTRKQGRFIGQLILLDTDRLESDIRAGRGPASFEGGVNFELVFLKPNIEGFYYRLHEGYENKAPSVHRTDRELIKIWPEYKKNTPSIDLDSKFTVEDVKRVANVDSDILKLVNILGL